MHESVKQTLKEIWTKAGPIESELLSEREVKTIEQRHQVQVGSPASLGFFGFATGTMVLAFVLSGIMPLSSLIAVVPVLLVFAGVAQFTAALYGFTRGSAFLGTVFGAYGANYALLAVFIWMEAGKIIPVARNDDFLLGVGLLCLGYISFILGFAALRLNPTYTVIVWSLVPGYVLPGVTAVAPFDAAVGHVGGYFLFLSAVAAFYAGAVVVINSTHEDHVLSLGRFRNRP